MANPNADYVEDSQTALLVVYASSPPAADLVSQLSLHVAYSANLATKYVKDSELALLVPYAVLSMTSPYASQVALTVVYGIGTSTNSRTRAWTYTLDGHTFYVLDLGVEGTFLYDTSTKQWCEFRTEGYTGWNMHVGTIWGEGRISGGDALSGQVWELKPDLVIDEGFRDLVHVATGNLMTRNRVFKAVEHFTLMTSAADLPQPSGGVSMSLRWSDDLGDTWSASYPLTVDPTDNAQDATWRSIGSFKSPGRIFEVTDIGGRITIDEATAGIDSFDEDGPDGQ